MDADERLETLCEEFSSLEESEKDSILELSQVLIYSFSVKPCNGQKGETPSNVIIDKKGE